MRYTDEFRAQACVMLQSQGWPQQKGALSRVAQYLGVPPTTLRRWSLGLQNPPPAEMVKEKTLDLREAIQDELAAIFGELPHARPDASYKDLATAAAILIDKLQLLEGKPTERTEQIRSWREAVLAARREHAANGEIIHEHYFAEHLFQ